MLSASKSGSGLSTGYNLTRSLRFRASASAYLNRTFSTPTNNKIWTYSFWVKRGQLGAFQQVLASRPTSTPYSLMYFGDTDNFQFDDNASLYFATSQLFRDVASWYHIVVAIDTTQATSTNRFKLYVNGAQVTAFSSTTYPAQNYNTQLNTASSHAIGKGGVFTTNYLDGYLTEVNFIDGQALTPSSFDSTNVLTGVWQPARYTGTYGTNGFYLPFTDNSSLTTSSNVGLGKDFSGNGNYWTTNNISITAGVTYDSMTDVPTLTSATAANFAVLNPLRNALTLSNANLTFSSTGNPAASGTIGVTSGKWYWEVTLTSGPLFMGICDASASMSVQAASSTTSWVYYSQNGFKYSATAGSAYGATYTSGDVIGVALDVNAGTLVFYKNNTSQGTAYSGLTTGPYFPIVSSDQSGTTVAGSINFGQQPFTYTPPTGFVALNTYNLPTSTILAGNKVMDATLWTGTGATQTITNAGGFKPDLVWGKNRSGADQHFWGDSVRGLSYYLSSNSTGSEITSSVDITSLNSNGFTLGTGTDYNRSGYTFVGWQWQAGQGSTSSNTNGTITSTVSVNASAGFSVVTYTGTGVAATVGHGLGVAPSWIVVKRRDAVANWDVYHSSIGATGRLYLNTTDSTNTSSAPWNNTAPTSSVFTVGTATDTNASGSTLVAYCWTPIAGFSAMGSYLGNGSTSGPFVYCGFQPKFILIKSTTAARDWIIWDTVRNTFNIGTNGVLYPDTSGAEYSGGGAYAVAVTSNGFYLPVATTNLNASGETHIYAAFASNPFKNSLAF